MRGRFIAVVGHGPLLEREAGAVAYLRQLGSEVRALDLWEDPANLFRDGEADGERVRALIVEALDRPDLAPAVLRALRREPRLERCPALLAVGESHIARMDPAAGFDDFTLVPYVPSELYMRIRCLEWRRSEFSNEERLKIGAMVIDRSAREVHVEGRPIPLTTKEFSLLAYLSENRGRVKSREQLLARVWGASYEGGPRTVDIHVRRLRAKLGNAFPLQTVRGAGYKLPLDPTSGSGHE
ncbi:MAG: response regulator transcription factor [Myxococcales bacterium]|nr:response regulator transcription factor [Polyangiaceae bacterium]MDW8249837.1 response regulator transcription factor [Myxococcales bacterium]